MLVLQFLAENYLQNASETSRRQAAFLEGPPLYKRTAKRNSLKIQRRFFCWKCLRFSAKKDNLSILTITCHQNLLREGLNWTTLTGCHKVLYANILQKPNAAAWWKLLCSRVSGKRPFGFHLQEIRPDSNLEKNSEARGCWRSRFPPLIWGHRCSLQFRPWKLKLWSSTLLLRCNKVAMWHHVADLWLLRKPHNCRI